MCSMQGPLDAHVYWQGPADTFDHAELVTTSSGNRWSAPGQPAIYVAGDHGVTLVEAGRHSEPHEALERRVIWRMVARLGSVVDLREERTAQALGLVEPAWILDRARCQEVAQRLRAKHACEAIRVPSAGLADIPARWNLVIFVDHLRVPLEEVLSDPEIVGLISPSRPRGAAEGA